MIERTSASCGRVAPDVDELRLADVAGRQRELHARIHVAVRRDVAGACGRRCRAAVSKASSGSSSGPGRRRAEVLDVADQLESRTTSSQLLCIDVQVQDRAVAVHHRRDRRDRRCSRRRAASASALHVGIVVRVLLHQHVGEGHFHAVGLAAAWRRRSCARTSRDLGDRVVHFRPCASRC